MATPKIFESEYRFMCIVWEQAPVTGTELVRLANQRLEWKKSTTYTVIRRLCDRGVIENCGGVITPLFTQEEVQRQESREFISRTFGGSLSGLVAAFANSKALTRQEADEIRRIIDAYEEE